MKRLLLCVGDMVAATVRDNEGLVKWTPESANRMRLLVDLTDVLMVGTKDIMLIDDEMTQIETRKQVRLG